MTQNKMEYQPFQPSAEERAFLYQQAQELESYVSSLGSMTLLVEEATPVDEPENKSYAVTFVVAPESMEFRIRVEGQNLFDACIEARRQTQFKLNALVNALPASGEEPLGGLDEMASYLIH